MSHRHSTKRRGKPSFQSNKPAKRQRADTPDETNENDSDQADYEQEPSVKTEPTTPSLSSERTAASIDTLGLPPTLKSSTQSTALSAPSSSATKAKLIVVLLKAALFTIRTKSGYELASADTHASLLSKLKKDPAECRPDIVHHSLLTLLDSPLNKAGLLKVYVQCEGGELIDVNSACRIPRTYKRFAGLMVQLMHKLKIRSADSQQYLLKIIKNPVTDHLPPASLKLGTSVQGTLVNMNTLAAAIGGDKPRGEGLANPIVIAIGSHASGPADAEWAEKSISVSQFPLSAAVAIGRICNAFEQTWGIL